MKQPLQSRPALSLFAHSATRKLKKIGHFVIYNWSVPISGEALSTFYTVLYCISSLAVFLSKLVSLDRRWSCLFEIPRGRFSEFGAVAFRELSITEYKERIFPGIRFDARITGDSFVSRGLILMDIFLRRLVLLLEFLFQDPSFASPKQWYNEKPIATVHVLFTLWNAISFIQNETPKGDYWSRKRETYVWNNGRNSL